MWRFCNQVVGSRSSDISCQLPPTKPARCRDMGDKLSMTVARQGSNRATSRTSSMQPSRIVAFMIMQGFRESLRREALRSARKSGGSWQGSMCGILHRTVKFELCMGMICGKWFESRFTWFYCWMICIFFAALKSQNYAKATCGDALAKLFDGISFMYESQSVEQ